MSITSSLLVFLLCVSLHACNARLLGAIGKEHEKKSVVQNKHDEKASLAKLDLTKDLGEANIGDTMEKQIRVEKEDNHNPTIAKAKKLVKGQGQGEKIASQTGQSLLSVSWRVPHKKSPGEQQPGFNSDYLPPKVHPPVHN
ncbi:Synaptonemal complex protein like [Actinidia chinensis var. chinensis]|uniref:Synaptonemal complex protein like n=1 Tax=Actinidia chinensis var. chinensis TaxID=1590841 RepID=A0A2R6S150_ACTCC|nr:Synaptonemal complex protein like [Actinidia chinensis var. chinensis]